MSRPKGSLNRGKKIGVHALLAAQKSRKQQIWIDPGDFRLARARAGMSIDEAALKLNVTSASIRNWESGNSPVPYTAFKVMRLLAGYVIGGNKWDGWIMHKEVLYSPEGRAFEPHELRYISHYFSMARRWLREEKVKQVRGLPNPEKQPMVTSTAPGSEELVTIGDRSLPGQDPICHQKEGEIPTGTAAGLPCRDTASPFAAEPFREAVSVILQQFVEQGEKLGLAKMVPRANAPSPSNGLLIGRWQIAEGLLGAANDTLYAEAR